MWDLVGLVGLVSLFNSLSTIPGLFKTKSNPCITVRILLNHRWRNKWFHASSKSVSRKVNVTAWMEFELTHYDVADQHISHYSTGTLFPQCSITVVNNALEYLSTKIVHKWLFNWCYIIFHEKTLSSKIFQISILYDRRWDWCYS